MRRVRGTGDCQTVQATVFSTNRIQCELGHRQGSDSTGQHGVKRGAAQKEGKKNLDKKKLSTLETSLNGTLAHLTG